MAKLTLLLIMTLLQTTLFAFNSAPLPIDPASASKPVSFSQQIEQAIKIQQQATDLQGKLANIKQVKQTKQVDQYLELHKRAMNLQQQATSQQNKLLNHAWSNINLWQQRITELKLIQDYTWIKAKPGQAVKQAVVAGYSPQGAIHICHAFHNDGVHPGQLTAKGCHLSYAGKAFYAKRYEVLVSRFPVKWSLMLRSRFAFNYTPPSSAIVGGHQQGKNLYICRAIYKGVIHAGKVVSSACDIAVDDREVRLAIYSGAQPAVMTAPNA
ncbi:MAG: DUF3421 domain-containing protein [Coxiellaceae bacterium]|nr:DUF3421 domain-containing protein [Coxiellaceae bacterium]